MKKKFADVLFCFLCMVILIIPMALLNVKPDQTSAIDNKRLTEWESFSFQNNFRNGFQNYLNDRIGFREEAIDAYTVLNDKLFHVLVHPLYMYGQNGNIYYKESSYIAGFQRINNNEAFMDSMISFLEKTKDYLDKKDIGFVYFLAPDKKTIYPEYFPKTVHVSNNKSWTELMEEKLSKTEVDFVVPVEELKKAKEENVIYNVKYDTTHWNELGAFVGHKLLDQRLQKYLSNVSPLSEEDYDLTYEHRDSLDISKFRIDENVPKYVLKEERAEDGGTLLVNEMVLNTNTFYEHFVNPQADNDEVALFFLDSYFGPYSKFYKERYKEVYFLHRNNYQALQYYINLIQPDVVIFETAERSMLEEMQQFYYFEGYRYVPPFDQKREYEEGDREVSLSFDSMAGAGVSGKLLEVYDDGLNMMTIQGSLYVPESPGDYHVYVKVGNTYYETSYEYLMLQETSSTSKQFQFAIQKRFLHGEEIEFFAVDNANGKLYKNLVRLEIKGAQEENE